MKSLLQGSWKAALAAAIAWGIASRGMAQMPATPASPLAGGIAAAQGGQSYMDVNGNPIILPASYGQPCGPEGCMDGGGYGDASGGCPGGDGAGGWVDYGGCTYPEQSGPHYFDVAVYSVFLTPDRVFNDVQPFGAVGVQGPRILDPNATFNDYEAGWAIAGRYDLGPLSVFEATYMGIYDIGFHDTVNSVDVANNGANFQLTSVFSDYGLVPITGLDQGSVYSLDYKSTLQSAEATYRRYWVGYNPRISGTLLTGFRYIQLTEDLDFNALALGGTTNLQWESTNDLAGWQFGGDVWVTLRQGLRLGTEGKLGIYNNNFSYRHATSIPDARFTNVDFINHGDQVSFAGQSSVDLVADILPSFSLRGGYQVLYMSSLVTVGNNINPLDPTSTAMFTQANAVYHGFHAGLEYIW
jgi:hypothetical protein